MSKNKSNRRSITRFIAVQALYQAEFYNFEHKPDDLLKDAIKCYALQDADENDFEEEAQLEALKKRLDHEFLAQLFPAIIEKLPEIDQIIGKNLKKEWNLENLADVARQIIRFGVFELKFFPDTPAKVIINEYVNIVGCYYEEDQISFVNGILDVIAKEFTK